MDVRLLLAQGADALTFLAYYTLIGSSIHQERNPILILFMAIGGVAAVVIVKITVTALVIYHRHRIKIRRRWLQTVGLSVATASGIVGAGFNFAAIVHTLVLRG